MVRSFLARLHRPVYAARLAALVPLTVRWMREGDRVLDVGCGYGELGRAILESGSCPAGVKVQGLEMNRRGDELIEVESYDGISIPHGDRTFDVVLLADVLHHAPDPDRLLEESARVARRAVIVKDHKTDGLLARVRVSLIDWAANAPYGVACLYRYNTLVEWRAWLSRHGLSIEEELCSMRIYPPVINLLFGRKLHYWAVTRPGPR